MDMFRQFMSTPVMRDANVAHAQIRAFAEGGTADANASIAMNMRWTILHQTRMLLDVQDPGFLDNLRACLQAYLDQSAALHQQHAAHAVVQQTQQAQPAAAAVYAPSATVAAYASQPASQPAQASAAYHHPVAHPTPVPVDAPVISGLL